MMDIQTYNVFHLAVPAKVQMVNELVCLPLEQM